MAHHNKAQAVVVRRAVGMGPASRMGLEEVVIRTHSWQLADLRGPRRSVLVVGSRVEDPQGVSALCVSVPCRQSKL